MRLILIHRFSLKNILKIAYISNSSMIKFKYDALSSSSTIKDAISVENLNPFRFKGYCYNSESRMYYYKVHYYIFNRVDTKMKLFIIFITNIILLVLLITGIVHVCVTNEVYLFAPFLLLYIFSVILLMFAFANYISSREIKKSNEHFFNFKEETKVEIFAKRMGNVFSLTYNDKEIKFETNTKIFKKGMFVAYIVRNIRFPEVSNKLPLLYLFKKRLPLKNITLKQLIININGKKYLLLKDGVSINRYSFINKCWYYKDLLFKRSDYYIGRTVCNINEKIFEEGRMDFTIKNKNR